MTRPEPVEAYRLCELPVGTKVKQYDEDEPWYVAERHKQRSTPVYVVEWPQRVYDGIPAIGDLERVLLDSESCYLPGGATAAARIRAAIAVQEQDQ